MFFDNMEVLSLYFDEDDRQIYFQDEIEYKKKMSGIQEAARQKAKLSYCYYCKNEVTSFCNSHSVPKFCLKRLSVDGKLYYANTLIDLPFLDSEQGIKQSGVFHLICRDCDSKIFQQYEDPESYHAKPNGQILAQIAMKDYLQMIAKRLHEEALYNLLSDKSNYSQNYLKHILKTISLDLLEYKMSFERAKIGALGGHNDWYYLCYYQKLNYVVPIAFQGGITLICDFEDNVINDIYNMSLDYHTKEIHIAIFPLEHESVVMLFIDARDKRYRKFYRQLNKLTLHDQLAAINYIVFSYSENIFISKNIDNAVLEDPKLIDTARKTTTISSDIPCGDALSAAVSEFSLSKRNEIPNLLSKEYSLE